MRVDAGPVDFTRPPGPQTTGPERSTSRRPSGRLAGERWGDGRRALPGLPLPCPSGPFLAVAAVLRLLTASSPLPHCRQNLCTFSSAFLTPDTDRTDLTVRHIEVTQANAAHVPQEYIRKQTLVNAERYITPELKEYESLVLNAETQIH